MSIFIGIGSNLRTAYGCPKKTCISSVNILFKKGIQINYLSKLWYSSAVPSKVGPSFINTVVNIKTLLNPLELLNLLHVIEEEMGRKRKKDSLARKIDLDLIDYNGYVVNGNICLPHPRMHNRLFVLGPLYELAPNWRHPLTGKRIDSLLAKINRKQIAYPI